MFIKILLALTLFLIFIITAIFKFYAINTGFILMHRDIDPAIFEFLIIVSGAGLSSIIVGSIFNSLEIKDEEFKNSIELIIKREGIKCVFENFRESQNVIGELKKLIPLARNEIVFCGMGLTILYENDELIKLIAKQFKKRTKPEVTIIAGHPENGGVTNRIHEEKEWSNEEDLDYDPEWSHKHISKIRKLFSYHLKKNQSDSNSKYLKIIESKNCPMFTFIKIDTTLFFFLYGTPNIFGPSSPWIQMISPQKRSVFKDFFENIIDYYKKREISE